MLYALIPLIIQHSFTSLLKADENFQSIQNYFEIINNKTYKDNLKSIEINRKVTDELENLTKQNKELYDSIEKATRAAAKRDVSEAVKEGAKNNIPAEQTLMNYVESDKIKDGNTNLQHNREIAAYEQIAASIQSANTETNQQTELINKFFKIMGDNTADRDALVAYNDQKVEGNLFEIIPKASLNDLQALWNDYQSFKANPPTVQEQDQIDFLAE